MALTPEMQAALIDLSTFYHAEPETVFQRVLDVLVDQYGQTMAMITLTAGPRIRYRAARNVHPALRGLDSISLTDSY